MTANQEVTTRGAGAVEGGTGQAEALERRHDEDYVLVPAVDILEDKHGITVHAEMPGVSKDRLNVQADRNTLLIEGDAVIDMPPGMEALYADVQATKFRRSFVLSSELETERIEASMKDGVLTVRIPKRTVFSPRRIEVQ